MANHLFPSVVFLLFFLCLFLGNAWALKCRTEDGPTSDEVRKVIRTCMRRITSESDNKTSSNSNEYEYDNYDSSYSESDSREEEDGKEMKTTGKSIGSNGGQNQRGNDQGRNGGYDMNGNNRKNDRRNRDDIGGRQRNHDYDFGMGRRSDDGRNQNGRYKRQYYNDGMNVGYGYSYQQQDRYNRDRNNFINPNGGNSSSNSSNSSSNVERDRACMMQCFFQEMKMTNNEGFPDKHKVLHVVTKDLRDNELRDFYTDSIQECFHMISMDNKLKDKCAYSLKFVTCLADRGQANCNDWENETIMF